MSIFDRFRRQSETQLPKIEKRQNAFKSAERYKSQRDNLNQARRSNARSEWWKTHRISVLVATGFLIIVGIIVTAVVLLRGASQFKIQKIVVRGNQVAKQEQILEAVNWVKDQNLYALNVAQVQRDLLNKFPYFKQVQVRKILPDNLLIEIAERAAVMTYANISTSVTTDADGRIIAVFDQANLAALGSEVMNIIQGYGSVDLSSVQQKYYTKFQDDLPKFRLKWEEVKPEDKATALAELIQEYQALINEYLLARIDKVDPSIKDTLPIMQDLSNAQFKQGDLMPTQKFKYGYALLDFFRTKNLKLKQLLWITDFNIIVTLESGTQIIFTATRDLDEQLQAFETIRRVEDISRARSVDVRANVVSVR